MASKILIFDLFPWKLRNNDSQKTWYFFYSRWDKHWEAFKKNYQNPLWRSWVIRIFVFRTQWYDTGAIYPHTRIHHFFHISRRDKTYYSLALLSSTPTTHSKIPIPLLTHVHNTRNAPRDPNEQRWIRFLLLAKSNEGRCIICSIHDWTIQKNNIWIHGNMHQQQTTHHPPSLMDDLALENEL